MRGRKRNDNNYRPSDEFQAELYRELQKEREMLAALMEEYSDERDKRLPVGFVGSRGKKSINDDDYFDMDEKRSPMGFTGVRGKKSEFQNFIDMNEKRVPFASFFGMRGKKQPVVRPTDIRLSFIKCLTLSHYSLLFSCSRAFLGSIKNRTFHTENLWVFVAKR